LRTLYERCCRSRDLRPVQIGEHLERHPPRDTLPHLFAGSWIHHNFAIWIGHEEDNTAWEALHRTREYLRGRVGEWERERVGELERAWNELYIAEGSDWFWWYGDEHPSALDMLFDHLFRKHLQNVYLILGDVPPADLSRPIKRRGQRPSYTLPRSFLSVKIDGRFTFFEWINAGHYTCQAERGTMALATHGLMKDLYFGFNAQALLIRVDCEGAASESLANCDMRVGFAEPAGYELRIPPARAHPPTSFALLHHDQPTDATGVEVAVDRIVEIAIPFARLGLKVDQPIHFFVEVMQGGQSRDRAPQQGAIGLTRPSTDFEQIMWDVLY
jgi:hypothetical protein